MFNLKNWFRSARSQNDTWYFTEYSIRFDGSDSCERSLQTQAVTAEGARTLEKAGEYVMRVHFENDQLTRVEEYYGVEWSDRELDPDEQDFRYRPIPVHPVFQLEYRAKGVHQLGGNCPDHFAMPHHPDLPVSIQYIGRISQSDPRFKWIPFDDLHLVYPLFAGMGPLFLDYSNPLEPVILNDFQSVHHTFKCVTPDTYIEFERKNFGGRPIALDTGYDIITLESGIGWGGVANWIQHPDIPRCPKSGNVMKFLAQFETTDLKTVKKVNVGPEDPQIQCYLDTLNFWCDGDLYIFLEPESKIVCLLIQNT